MSPWLVAVLVYMAALVVCLLTVGAVLAVMERARRRDMAEWRRTHE